MQVLRRRTSSGIIQRFFTTLGVSSDCVFQTEARASSFRDIFFRSENLTTLSADRMLGSESLSVVFGRALDNIESRSSVVRDVFSITENQASALVSGDAFVRLENRAQMFSDARPIFESLQTTYSDANEWFEHIATLVESAVYARLESLQTATVAAPLKLEGLGLALLSFDATVQLEHLVAAVRDGSGPTESLSRYVRDINLLAEAIASAGITSATGDAFVGIEFLQNMRNDTNAAIEDLSRRDAHASILSENLSLTTIRSDTIAHLETITSVLNRIALRVESSLQVSQVATATLEALFAARADEVFPLSVFGQIVAQSDASIQIETRAGFGVDTSPINLEARASLTRDLFYQAETLQSVAQRYRSSIEGLRAIVAEFPAAIENLSIHMISSDALANLEISGTNTSSAALLAVIEMGGGVSGIDTPISVENRAVIAWPVDPDAPMPIDGPYLVLDRTYTNLSSSRIRLITEPLTAPGVQARPFDPLPALTMDTFGFDFTGDVAAASIVSTKWTATFDPGSSGAVDDVPQGRVITAWAPTTVWITNPLDSVPQSYTGAFSVAAIGFMPLSAIGGTYTLTVTCTLSDTRIISASSRVLCAAPPGQSIQ